MYYYSTLWFTPETVLRLHILMLCIAKVRYGLRQINYILRCVTTVRYGLRQINYFFCGGSVAYLETGATFAYLKTGCYPL